jgi:hypothetical protein
LIYLSLHLSCYSCSIFLILKLWSQMLHSSLPFWTSLLIIFIIYPSFFFHYVSWITSLLFNCFLFFERVKWYLIEWLVFDSKSRPISRNNQIQLRTLS